MSKPLDNNIITLAAAIHDAAQALVAFDRQLVETGSLSPEDARSYKEAREHAVQLTGAAVAATIARRG